jgi:hypothetical protein
MSTADIEHEVAALTRNYPIFRSGWQETPAGLREHPGPVAIGTTVYVHGSGHWRPGVVERVTTRGERTTFTVVHSTPSNPTRMHRKRVQLNELRILEAERRP